MGRRYEPNTNPQKSRKISIRVSSDVDKMTYELLVFHGFNVAELYEEMITNAHAKMTRNKKAALERRKAELLKQISDIEEVLKD